MKQILQYLHAKYQYFQYSRHYKNNKIIIVDEQGYKKSIPVFSYIKNFEITFRGDNNTVIIEMPQNMRKCIFKIYSDNNNVYIGKNCSGKYDFKLIGNDNSIRLGENNTSSGINVILNDSNLEVGDDCMFSNSIKLWTDGHSVIDNETRELLNPSGKTVKIGNHVWIGENVTLLKKAVIPDNCIVAHSSIVTKEFTENNCVLAGNPAKIVKRGINWHPASPKDYKKD